MTHVHFFDYHNKNTYRDETGIINIVSCLYYSLSLQRMCYHQRNEYIKSCKY